MNVDTRLSASVVALGTMALLGAAPAGPRDLAITALVLEGDTIPEIGLVTSIDNIAVNDSGQWLVEADTDHGNADADGVLIRNGQLYWREDADLKAPHGARLDTFDSITLNNAGHGGFNFFLAGTGGMDDDSGVYGDFFGPGSDPFEATVLVVQEGEEAPGLTPGTPFIGFFDVKINNVDHLLCVASVDDPDIPSTVDRALYILESDADDGGITAYTLIAKEGDILIGQIEGIDDFETGPHESAINDSDYLLFGADLTGDTTRDGVIYLFDPFADENVLIAQEGDLSPIPDRYWNSLSSSELDLNNGVDFVYSGRLTGDSATDTLIVRNGEKFKQEGDAPPDVPGEFSLTSFGTGPLEISDDGLVLWYGDWDDPDTDIDTGLFLENRLLVQEGVTEIDGVVIDTLRGIEDGYHLSDNGRFVIFEAILVNGREGAFLIDLGGDCPEDVNGDLVVDIDDLFQVLGAWGPCDDCPEDVNGDTVVDIDDVFAVLAAWGPCP